MKNNKTYYQLILDSSGSMSSCQLATQNGFNEQVQMIKSMQEKFPEQEIRVSLTVFNHEIKHQFDTVDPKKVKELNEATYVPSGSTALLDAIGDSIHRMRVQVDKEVEKDEATVVFVILTDGYENASTRFNYDQIKSMITDLEATDNWTFTFLGADIDAMATAGQLNIRAANTKSFSKAQMGEQFAEVTESMEDYLAAKVRGVKKKDFLK